MAACKPSVPGAAPEASAAFSPALLPSCTHRTAGRRLTLRKRRRSAARTLILGGALCSVLPADAAVYRCRTDGAPTFAQFCAPADRVGTQPATSGDAFVRFQPLSPQEREALAQLSRQLAATRRSAQKRRLKAGRQAQAGRAAAAERCARAREALEALAERRRKGYGAREARALKDRERALNAERKANC